MTPIRPSSLPALSQCSAFVGGSSEYTGPGTARHHALEKLFADDPAALDGVPEEQHEGVRWAVDYIKLHAPLMDHTIQFEEPATAILPDFSEIRGTPDAVCGPHLFDLKWRRFDYTAQMAAYALMRLAHFERVTVHILFAEGQRYERYELDEPAALKIVEPILERVANHPEPTACNYCGWCAKKLTCAAFQAPALAAVASREDWKLETWHPSQVTDPAQMVKLLRAAPFLRKLADSIQYHAREMWTVKGVELPGCELKKRAGKRKCTDINGAFAASKLEPEQFLSSCDLKFGDLEKAYAKHHGITAAAAKRELKKLLDPFVKQGEPSLSVVPINTETEEGED